MSHWWRCHLCGARGTGQCADYYRHWTTHHA